MAAASSYGKIYGCTAPQIVLEGALHERASHRIDTRRFNQGHARHTCANAYLLKDRDAGNGLGRCETEGASDRFSAP